MPATVWPRSGRRRDSQRIKLGLNKSIVIDLPTDAYDILVANPAVADAVTRTARRIYLFGKAVGDTNIFVFGPMASRSSASICSRARCRRPGRIYQALHPQL